MSGKVKYHELTEKEKKIYLGDFYSMVSSLKTRDEVKNFFKDLLTLSEIVMISRRIQIAKMLILGRTYEEIKKDLKVGASNVAQVERWLNNGFGGYQKVVGAYIEKIEKAKTQNQKKTIRNNMLRKYAHHRFIFDLLDK